MIIPRGSSYQVRIWRNGEKVTVGSYSAKRHGGKRKALEAAKAAEAQALTSTLGTANETVAEFAGRWLIDFNEQTSTGQPRWQPRTIRMHGLALRTFCEATAPDGRGFGALKLTEVTKPMVRPWAMSTPHTYLRAVRAMFSDALRDGQIATNPCSKLRISQPVGRANIDVLTEDQVEQLCRLAQQTDDGFGPTLAAAIATAAWTGIRPGELTALTPDDVHPERFELDVRRQYVDGEGFTLPKKGKTRIGIVLPARASAYIAAIPAIPNRRYVFQLGSSARSDPEHGPVIRAHALNYRWQQVREAFGKPDLAFYELRHFGATWLLEQGCSEAEVAWQLGHADTSLVEQLYTHPSDEWRRDSLKVKLGLAA